MSPFLLSYVPPHTPRPIYCPSWPEADLPLSVLILTCSQDWVSAIFCMYTKYGDVGYYSLLTAWSISLNIFRVFGVLALSLQGLNLVQVQVKLKSINTFHVALQRGFISEESCGAACVPKAHSRAGGYGWSAQVGIISDWWTSLAGAEPWLSCISVPFSWWYCHVCISGLSTLSTSPFC